MTRIRTFEIPQISAENAPALNADFGVCELGIGFEQCYELPMQPASVLLSTYRGGVCTTELALSAPVARELAAALIERAASIEGKL